MGQAHQGMRAAQLCLAAALCVSHALAEAPSKDEEALQLEEESPVMLQTGTEYFWPGTMTNDYGITYVGGHPIAFNGPVGLPSYGWPSIYPYFSWPYAFHFLWLY